MGDCANVKIRDLLPELLHDRLSAAERVEVRTHVDQCADCRAELEVLTRARALMTVPGSVSAARIAAAVPPYRRRSSWRRMAESPLLRVAAVVILFVGSMVVVRGRSGVEVPDSTSSVGPIVPSATELTVGEALADLTDNDLRVLLDELPQIEAVTPAEGDVVVPALDRAGE
jgi:predicted anti-sigma-YlaC factor YlaD